LGHIDIVSLLENRQFKPLFPRKRRITTDWMEICNLLGDVRSTELRDIVKAHVDRSNVERVAIFFDYSGTLDGFKTYVDTLSKRKICTYLAKYYEAQKPTFVHEGCLNDTTISGDDLPDLPPERVIKLTQDGHTYCFDVLEVSSLNGENPYNRKRLPTSFVREATERGVALPKDIRELKQRDAISKNALREEVVALQDRADALVPYFPRRKFVLLNTNQLGNLAARLAEYDPAFNLERLRTDSLRASTADKPLIWKRGILKRLLVHPETLGNVLIEFLS
jgi:hypothetical protein